MITAIPMNYHEIANHFTKALSLVFFDDQGNELHREPNPALNTSCSGKTAMLELFKRHNAERFVVRHIGQKMLERLLNNSYSVFQVRRGRHAAQNLAVIPDTELIPLTAAEHGSPSVNHDKKKAQGRKCCGQDGLKEQAHRSGSCCGSHSTPQHTCHSTKQAGRGGCCH
ncbi:NifB/NifX family molybdenum-iron cluster-binding protein [Echinimonas agarilytica]|uniref:Dinitrogenase iron-molybdenum cofactor n=1 Tax=Echinimonas agarilytica TaxID=1215918 RepID=A0AA41W435_9GAMM|nr:NifB/NifX family molybdenum-iron cluster-binding protein [Echinimonas agarilytica]MCM2678178.1 dinitrogenase iron-molybdenum cofactor [Echinimonas agarilytica]